MGGAEKSFELMGKKAIVDIESLCSFPASVTGATAPGRLLQILDGKNMQSLILPRNMEVVVASFGGVGTTFLLSFLSQYRKTNHPDDADGFKHSPLPPVSFNSKVKFVYVYGNPELAAISLFRRDLHHYQSKKLQRWIREPISSIPLDMTLEQYASLGDDKFHFRDHFYNWYDRYLAHPTLFLRYETIFDNIAPLLDFLDIPRSHIDRFPKKSARASSRGNIADETLQQLHHMYGGFSEELAALDDVEVRTPSHRMPAMTYLNRAYLKAWGRQAYREAGTWGRQAYLDSTIYLENNNPKVYRTLQKVKHLLK